jgi:hypothetical protein
MEYKGVEYTVVRLADGTGWKWEVRFDERKNISGVTPVSRAFAIKLAEFEIDRVVGRRHRLPAPLGPSPGVAPHGIVATIIAKPAQLLE